MDSLEIERLNESLARHLGWTYCGCSGTCKGWIVDRYTLEPEFTSSMDFCIEYLVPKISGLIEIKRFLGNWACRISTSGYTHYDGQAETIPLAFCLAADRYFKGVR